MQIKWIHLHSLLTHFSFSSPVPCSIETVEDMIKMGVYVNDLNLHDSSRELILAGTQQSAELQLALDQVKPPDKERPISKADSCSTTGNSICTKSQTSAQSVVVRVAS